LPEGETPGSSCPPFDIAKKECLELLSSVVKQNLERMGPMERDTLLESELNPDYSPTLSELAEEKGTSAPAMRQRVHRARVRFRSLLLSSDRLADLLRCLGIQRGAA
jgi:hypothetical protein